MTPGLLVSRSGTPGGLGGAKQPLSKPLVYYTRDACQVYATRVSALQVPPARHTPQRDQDGR